MLTTSEAENIASLYRSQFIDTHAYVTSVNRYLDRIPVAKRSTEGLSRWLREDLQQEGVVSALLTPSKPEHAAQDLPTLVDDCDTCRGRRLLRHDLPLGHADFGKLLLCPSCGGRPTHNASRAPVANRNVCYVCGAFEDESARTTCRNPKWHQPNWDTGTYPRDRPVSGWHGIAAAVKAATS